MAEKEVDPNLPSPAEEIYTEKEENGTTSAEHIQKVNDDIHSSLDCSIHVRLIPAKMSYFFLDFFNGSIVPYLIVFLASTGLDMKEAGFITGMRLVSSAFAALFWGYLADRTGRRKLIFVILCVGTAVTIFPSPWVAREFKLQTTVNGSKEIRKNQSVNISDKKTSVYDGTNGGHASFSNNLFYVMFSIIFISNIFSNPMIGVIDSCVMNVIKTNRKKTDYGKQRMFGAFGFGIANFLAGFVADHVHETSFSQYIGIFYVFLPSILLLLPFGFVLTSQTNIEISGETKGNKGRILLTTFRKVNNIMFILSTFISGVMNSVLSGYMFQLMDDQMHATKTIMGLANLVSALSEIVVFPFTSTCLRLCGGAVGGIEIAIFSYFVRFIAVSFINNPWLVLPVQLLNCLSFALFWAAAVEYTESIAQNEIYVTMFSILNSVYFNVAGLVGYQCGGVVYHKYGGKTLFQISAYLSLTWVLIMILYYQVGGCIRKRFLTRRQKEMSSSHTIDTVVTNC